jgi:hypothetical protein
MLDSLIAEQYMTSKPSQHLKSILHPYIFVLKEGETFKKDFLDYSLMMLYVHSIETISSPAEDFDKIVTLKKSALN